MSGALAIMGTIGGARIDISGGFAADDEQLDPTSALAIVAFESDGDVLEIDTAGSVDAGNWIEPTAFAPGSYEISVHQDSGDALDGTSDALDTWIALSTSPSWALAQSGVGTKAASLTASIRLGGTTLSTGTIDLSVAVT